MHLSPISKVDLDHLYYGLNEKKWSYFLNKKIFLTGGTGFVGKWLLTALLLANRRLGLNCKIEVLTRSKKKFCEMAPHLAINKSLIFHEGDVMNFKFPKGKFDIIIHAALDIEKKQNPIDTLSTCVIGTERVIEFSNFSKADDFLLTSSGAVYGTHPSEAVGLPEEHFFDRSVPLTSVYAEGKRISEQLLLKLGSEKKLKVKIARIYAQVGPYLPLNKHFAIGNFINDVCENREIQILGDGSPIRSYMYAADLSIWLLSMISSNLSLSVYNIGGKESISIEDLAKRVINLVGSKNNIKIMNSKKNNSKVEAYVPNTNLIRKELKLSNELSLDESILRTVEWVKKNNKIII